MNVVLFFTGSNHILYPHNEHNQHAATLDKLVGNSRSHECGWWYIALQESNLLCIHDDTYPEESFVDHLEAKLNNADGSRLLVVFHAGSKAINSQDQQGLLMEIKAGTPSTMTFSASYSHDPGVDIWTRFSDLVMYFADGNLSEANQEFELLIETINKRPIVRKLSLIKHRIANLFKPLDVDLQGLAETKFDQRYWREVVAEHTAEKNGKPAIRAKLDELHHLISDSSLTLDTVKSVVEAARDVLEQQKNRQIEEAFNIVEERANDVSIEPIVEHLINNHREGMQSRFVYSPDLFHRWLDSLDVALANLRERLAESLSQYD